MQPARSDDRRALPHRAGTTDSEAIFLAALARGLDVNPVEALRATLADVKDIMRAAGVTDPLRFTATLTDGHTLWAFRWVCDACPPTLYYKQGPGGLLLVSEPIDVGGGWQEVPRGGVLVAAPGQAVP